MISEIFPPVDAALELEPEGLAVPLLERLSRIDESGSGRGLLHRSNFMGSDQLREYAGGDYEAIARVVMEAWRWLEREILIAPDPRQGGEWIFVTRRGRKFRESGDIGQFKAASLLPPETLDSKLASKVRPAFLIGDYETAVFNAFREVEIRIRTLGGYSRKDLGVKLMRKAFKPEEGRLIDAEQEVGEQQGIADLFAGAIGSFKNPSSHREVDFQDPVEIVELIGLADLLIKIAERRKPEENG